MIHYPILPSTWTAILSARAKKRLTLTRKKRGGALGKHKRSHRAGRKPH